MRSGHDTTEGGLRGLSRTLTTLLRAAGRMLGSMLRGLIGVVSEIPLPGRRILWTIIPALLIFFLYILSYAIYTRWLPASTVEDWKPVARWVFAPLQWFGDGALLSSEESQLMRLEVVAVAPEEITPAVFSAGKIEHYEKVEIVSRNAGRIERIYVHEGDVVASGQLLVQMEKLPLQIQLMQQRAALESARARLQLAEERYATARRDREKVIQSIDKQRTQVREIKAHLDKTRATFQGQELLYKQGGISLETYRQARAELISAEADYLTALKDLQIISIGYRDEDIRSRGLAVPASATARKQVLLDINTAMEKAEVSVARAEVEAARAEVNSISLLLNETAVRSPLRGIVSERNRSPGEEVTGPSPQGSSQAILVLVDIEKVYAVINVREERATEIEPEMAMRFTVDVFPEEDFSARVTSVNPVVDERTHTVEVRALMENPGLRLRPGMFIRAEVATGEPREVILIPTRYVIPRQGNQAWVYIVQAGTVYRASVETGEEYGDRMEIVSGLEAGNLLAAEKFSLLRDGLRVEAVQSGEPGPEGTDSENESRSHSDSDIDSDSAVDSDSPVDAAAAKERGAQPGVEGAGRVESSRDGRARGED